MTSYRSGNRRIARGVPTAVLIDYNNLYDEIDNTIDSGEFPDEIILDMISLLPQFARSEWNGALSVVRAYADFGLIEDGGTYVQQELMQRGVDPRIVVAHDDDDAPRLRLCIEAADLVNQRPDIEVIVVLTGINSFDALANFVGHRGRRLALMTVRTEDEQPETYHPLLSYGAASGLLTDAPEPVATPGADRPTEPREHRPLQDEVLIQAIEIVNEHFGQYDEVYLTPLLRKLTELLGDAEEPKTIIADLSDAGASRLEKRKGYPHDYTVLILDRDHPDVARLARSAAPEEEPAESARPAAALQAEDGQSTAGVATEPEPTGDGAEEVFVDAEVSVSDSVTTRVSDQALA